MPLLKRATESTYSDTTWIPVPEGLWRWIIGKPSLKLWETRGDYSVTLPLELTESERTRLKTEHGEPAEGEMQSYRARYEPGLSLGYFDKKAGAYKTTKLVDFLCFSLGASNAKALRKWFEQGGGPPRPDDLNDQQAELDAIAEWLGWFENMEIYGSIRHEDDKKDPTKKWARFGGPMPVGSLPGQKDDEYQAFGRGKLRAILAASGDTRESQAKEHAANGVTTVDVADDDSKPAVQFTQDGHEVSSSGDGSAELPWG